MGDIHVGIDFGTTTTLVAIQRGEGLPQTVPIGRSTPWLPSVAALDEAGHLIFGEDAADQPLHRQIRSVKTHLTAGSATVDIDGSVVAVVDIVRGLLNEALERARGVIEDFNEATRFFLGCPALWTGKERRLLADIANDLGLDVDVADIIDEPVAAGLFAIKASLFNRGRALDGRIVVFDAGGGTLDVAYLDATSGPGSPSEANSSHRPDFTVLSAEGVMKSGDAVDELVVAALRHQIAGLTPRDAAQLLLRRRATEIKEALSTDHVRDVLLGEQFPARLHYERSDLENVFRPQMQQALKLVASVVRGALLRTSHPMISPYKIRATAWSSLSAEVNHVVLVGGLSQMPIIGAELRRFFPNALVEIIDEPQQGVARGLALGRDLYRLNLPRPPVDFIIRYPLDLINDETRRDWAEKNRYLYRAFTPLYSPEELLRGHSPLGHDKAIRKPDKYPGRMTCKITAIAPDRARTRLKFRLAGQTQLRDGIEITVGHGPNDEGMFKLYPNGELVIFAEKEHHKFRIGGWPNLHETPGDREQVIELEREDDGEWGSSIPGDVIYE